MNRQPLCTDLDVYAGNMVRVAAEVHPPDGFTGSVNPSTVAVAVTDINGVSEALTETVSYNFDDSAVLVEAYWEIPDDQRGGVYTVTFDVDGNMVGATERHIKVRARTEPNVPA